MKTFRKVNIGAFAFLLAVVSICVYLGIHSMVMKKDREKLIEIAQQYYELEKTMNNDSKNLVYLNFDQRQNGIDLYFGTFISSVEDYYVSDGLIKNSLINFAREQYEQFFSAINCNQVKSITYKTAEVNFNGSKKAVLRLLAKVRYSNIETADKEKDYNLEFNIYFQKEDGEWKISYIDDLIRVVSENERLVREARG